MVGTIARVSGRIETKSDQDWLVLTADELSVGTAYDWAVRPDCGAVVLFSGTVRDHADGPRRASSTSPTRPTRTQVVRALRRDRAEPRAPLAGHRTRRAAAPHRPPRPRRVVGRRRRVGAAPGRGVRGRHASRSTRSRCRRRSGSTRCGPTVPTGAPARISQQRLGASGIAGDRRSGRRGLSDRRHRHPGRRRRRGGRC